MRATVEWVSETAIRNKPEVDLCHHCRNRVIHKKLVVITIATHQKR
jgi:hypothetical protein